MQPRTLRTLYGVPDGERGNGAGDGYNRQGVASFDGSYLDVRSYFVSGMPSASPLSQVEYMNVYPAFLFFVGVHICHFSASSNNGRRTPQRFQALE